MAEPRKAQGGGGAANRTARERTRTYGETMNQYNRLLARFNEMNENGEYGERERRREEMVERITDRYANNIVNSPQYLRTFNEVAKRGGNNRASRDAAWAAADNVPIPYSTYARRRRANR